MAKAKIAHVCQSCGYKAAKWQGKCPGCGEWNTLVEEQVRDAATPARRGLAADSRSGQAVPIPDIVVDEGVRIRTGVAEVDRVLGGGLVPGGTALISGEPGIGKSTLLLQLAHWLTRAEAAPGGHPDAPAALYVTAEESATQLRLRAERLGALSPSLWVLAENDLDAILATIDKTNPRAVMLDSIQMTYWAELGAAPGSVGQVRECAAALVSAAKRRGFPLFLVGHVTKDGSIAGPKTLEHMVDVVLTFEGDRFHAARILRASKNRFGAVNEIAVFEMAADGLRTVADPSRLFLSGRRGAAPGTVVTAPLSGSRPVLAEVQALVAPAPPGMAKRRVAGAEPNRAAMVLAVLERRCEYLLMDKDVFINVVAGAEAREPGTDLAIALAVAGSVRDRAPAEDTVVVGEVGLGGEVRPVGQLVARLAEAERLGFRSAMIPAGSKYRGKLEVVEVATVEEALRAL